MEKKFFKLNAELGSVDIRFLAPIGAGYLQIIREKGFPVPQERHISYAVPTELGDKFNDSSYKYRVPSGTDDEIFLCQQNLDTNIGFGEILEDLKKLSKWLLTSPLMLLLTHPIINFGVINNYLPEKSVNVELKKPTPEKSPKSTKRKIPLPKKKEKCHCV